MRSSFSRRRWAVAAASDCCERRYCFETGLPPPLLLLLLVLLLDTPWGLDPLAVLEEDELLATPSLSRAFSFRFRSASVPLAL